MTIFKEAEKQYLSRFEVKNVFYRSVVYAVCT